MQILHEWAYPSGVLDGTTGPLEGTQFTVPASPGTPVVGDPADTLTTAASGYTTEIDRRPGDYQVTMPELLPGYYNRVLTYTTKTREVRAPGTVTVLEDQTTVQRVTDIRKTGTLTWQKVDASDKRRLLAGSKWKLTRTPDQEYGGEFALEVADVCEDTCPEGVKDVDTRAGYLKVNNLPWGVYELVETEAPAGFVADSTPITLYFGPADTAPADLPEKYHQSTVGDKELLISLVDEETAQNAVPNKQQQVPSLPFTGGISRDAFLIGGAIVLALATIAHLTSRPKRYATGRHTLHKK
ncbi:MAG: SpaA isopeptide-forming pilin-related protein [Actinomycetaceae bacterium]|nr:SpaA isopeptide-forming pilin-related protein [Actinomycetaceae bacterium]